MGRARGAPGGHRARRRISWPAAIRSCASSPARRSSLDGCRVRIDRVDPEHYDAAVVRGGPAACPHPRRARPATRHRNAHATQRAPRTPARSRIVHSCRPSPEPACRSPRAVGRDARGGRRRRRSRSQCRWRRRRSGVGPHARPRAPGPLGRAGRPRPCRSAAVGAAARARELASDTDEDQVAFRGEARLVPRLVTVSADRAVRAAAVAPTAPISSPAALGALGLHAAEWLVGRGARHLVLASRRAASMPRRRARIAALESQGATVDVVAADVSTRGRRRRAGRRGDRGRAAAARRRARGRRGRARAARRADAAEDSRRLRPPRRAAPGCCTSEPQALGLDLFVVLLVGGVDAGRSGAGALRRGQRVPRRPGGRAAAPGTGRHHRELGPVARGGMATGEHLAAVRTHRQRGLEPAAALRALDAARRQRHAAGHGGRHRLGRVPARAYEARRARPVLAAVAGAPAPASGAPPASSAPWVARLRDVDPAGTRGSARGAGAARGGRHDGLRQRRQRAARIATSTSWAWTR